LIEFIKQKIALPQVISQGNQKIIEINPKKKIILETIESSGEIKVNFISSKTNITQVLSSNGEDNHIKFFEGEFWNFINNNKE